MQLREVTAHSVVSNGSSTTSLSVNLENDFTSPSLNFSINKRGE